MKKNLILFLSVTSALVLSVLIGAHFIDAVLHFIKLSRANLSSIIIDPEAQILLYLSLIGLIGIFRARSYKK
jgi:hypothetical protein